MGKRAKVGVKPAVARSVNVSDGQTKVSKRANARKARPEPKQKKKRNNQLKRSAVKAQPKADKVAKVVTHLRKQASIEANAKERRVLTKV